MIPFLFSPLTFLFCNLLVCDRIYLGDGMSVKEEFINECIKNREYLGYSYADMANCLINMSEENYRDFELGKLNISKDNVARLIKVLCIEKPKPNGSNLVFDVDVSNEEKNDLLDIALMIEGALHD